MSSRERKGMTKPGDLEPMMKKGTMAKESSPVMADEKVNAPGTFVKRAGMYSEQETLMHYGKGGTDPVGDSHYLFFNSGLKTVMNGACFVALVVVLILALLGQFQNSYEASVLHYANPMMINSHVPPISEIMFLVLGSIEFLAIVYLWWWSGSLEAYEKHAYSSYMANFMLLAFALLMSVANEVLFVTWQELSMLIVGSLALFFGGFIFLFRGAFVIARFNKPWVVYKTTVFHYVTTQPFIKAYVTYLAFSFLNILHFYLRLNTTWTQEQLELSSVIWTGAFVLLAGVVIWVQLDGIYGFLFAVQLFQLSMLQHEYGTQYIWYVSLILAVLLLGVSFLASVYAWRRYKATHGDYIAGMPTENEKGEKLGAS